jgi:predicted nucleotidyltransferase
VEANLVRLNEEYRLPYVDDLIARKVSGPEKSVLEEADVMVHERAYDRLQRELEEAHDASRLPDVPSARAALNNLLVRLRLWQNGLTSDP